MNIEIKEAPRQLFSARIIKTLRICRPRGGDSIVKLGSKLDIDSASDDTGGNVCVTEFGETVEQLNWCL